MRTLSSWASAALLTACMGTSSPTDAGSDVDSDTTSTDTSSDTTDSTGTTGTTDSAPPKTTGEVRPPADYDPLAVALAEAG